MYEEGLHGRSHSCEYINEVECDLDRSFSPYIKETFSKEIYVDTDWSVSIEYETEKAYLFKESHQYSEYSNMFFWFPKSRCGRTKHLKKGGLNHIKKLKIKKDKEYKDIDFIDYNTISRFLAQKNVGGEMYRLKYCSKLKRGSIESVKGKGFSPVTINPLLFKVENMNEHIDDSLRWNEKYYCGGVETTSFLLNFKEWLCKDFIKVIKQNPQTL